MASRRFGTMRHYGRFDELGGRRFGCETHDPLPFPAPPGSSGWHVFDAARYCGELRSMPVLSKPIPPFDEVGSGKFDTPWERMQAAYFTAWARFWACWAGVPPLGASLAQDFCAAWNCGDCGLIPLALDPLPVMAP